MKRTLKLSQRAADIFLWNPEEKDSIWTGVPENALRFPFREGRLEGVISLNLDWQVPPERGTLAAESHGGGVDIPIACSRIAVVVEGESDEAVGEEEFLRTAQRLAHRYVNRMLSYIRVELCHDWVAPVPIGEWELAYFLYQAGAELEEDGKQVEVLGGRAAVLMMPAPMGFDDELRPLYKSKRAELWNFIQEGREVPPERELIASAKRNFVSCQYRVAAVEAVSALELGLAEFIGHRMRERQCYGRFEDVRDRLGAMTYLKALLPVAATQQQLESCRPSIGACVNLVAVRNRVAHRGAQPSAGEIGDIRRGIVAVERLLDVVASHEGGGLGGPAPDGVAHAGPPDHQVHGQGR